MFVPTGAVFRRHLRIGLDQMADYLAAGRVRDAEIAIQEEVAQAASGEFGIIRFDVGKFVDDRALIHHGLHCSRSGNRDNRFTVQFFGSARSRVRSFMCYAKITPAALRRRDFGGAAANTTKLPDRCRIRVR